MCVCEHSKKCLSNFLITIEQYKITATIKFETIMRRGSKLRAIYLEEKYTKKTHTIHSNIHFGGWFFASDDDDGVGADDVTQLPPWNSIVRRSFARSLLMIQRLILFPKIIA